MNPLLQMALLSVVSAGLAFLAGFMVHWGIWTQDAANQYVAAAGLGLLWLGWTWWKNSAIRVKILTALMLSKGSTENDLKAYLASGAPTPAKSTPPDTAPGVPK